MAYTMLLCLLLLLLLQIMMIRWHSGSHKIIVIGCLLWSSIAIQDLISVFHHGLLLVVQYI